MDDWLIREGREIIAVERDVEDADRWLLALDMLDIGSDALRNRHAARADAHNDDVVHALVALDNLMRDAREGAAIPSESMMTVLSVNTGIKIPPKINQTSISCRLSIIGCQRWNLARSA